MLGGKFYKRPIPSPILNKQHLPDPFFLKISESNNCQLHTGKTSHRQLRFMQVVHTHIIIRSGYSYLNISSNIMVVTWFHFLSDRHWHMWVFRLVAGSWGAKKKHIFASSFLLEHFITNIQRMQIALNIQTCKISIYQGQREQCLVAPTKQNPC